MAGQVENKKNKYAHLDQLSTEALDALLRADIESPDDINDEAIFYILNLIEQREKENPTGRLSDVDKAWADFQEFYNVPEGEGRSLYAEEYPDELNHPSKATTATRPRRFRIRRLMIAAAIVACLAVLAVPPALGYQNFFQMIGQWTESVFRFGSDTDPATKPAGSGEHTGEYGSLQAALDDYDITEPVAPTWIADDFDLVNVTAEVIPEFDLLNINAFYENAKHNSISISIARRAQGSYAYEKDDAAVIPYSVGGITHYIFENNGHTVATWYIETFECSIQADLPHDEVEKMIDSIYER